MDVILDANAYLQVLYNHGRKFLQTNQFVELLTHLRRTGSRLVIPELTYNEVVARYRDRLTTVANAARDAWIKLQQVGMQTRIDFLEPDIKSELSALGELLHGPAQGVQSIMYSDYSGVDVKEVARRGIGRVRPANDSGEELRDVILWLIVLHYAKQSKTRVAFISGDKTFQDAEGELHHSLKKDIERAGINIAFYRYVGGFVKDNALESEALERDALATLVSADELRGVATDQLLGSRFWHGTVVGAEVSRYALAEARRYRVAEDSYYVEARYTGEGTIRLARITPFFIQSNLAPSHLVPRVTTAVIPRFSINPAIIKENALVFPLYNEPLEDSPVVFNGVLGTSWIPPRIPETTESAYGCSFSVRLSMRIAKGARKSLEVDEFVLLGELTPVTASAS